MISTVASRAAIVVAMCAHLALGSASGAPTKEPGPLQVKHHWLVPHQSDGVTVMAVLRNDSAKVVVAWTTKTVFTFPDGTSTTNYLQEEIAPEGMSNPRRGPILPGQERTIRASTLKSPTGLPQSATITVVACVFADNTAAGQADIVRRIAENRRQTISDWEKALAILESSSKRAESSTDALASALEELERIQASSMVLRNVRLRVQMALERVQRNETAPDAQLSRLLELCRKQRIEANARLMPLLGLEH